MSHLVHYLAGGGVCVDAENNLRFWAQQKTKLDEYDCPWIWILFILFREKAKQYLIYNI